MFIRMSPEKPGMQSAGNNRQFSFLSWCDKETCNCCCLLVVDGKSDESYWKIAFFCSFFTLLPHINPYSIEGSWWMINRIFRTSSCPNSQTRVYPRKNCLQLWRSPNETENEQQVEKRWLSVILQREFGSLVPFSFMLLRSFLEVRWKLDFNPPFLLKNCFVRMK